MIKTRGILLECQTKCEKLQIDLQNSENQKQRSEASAREAIEKLTTHCRAVDAQRDTAESSLLVAKRRIDDEKRRADGLGLELKESLEREQHLQDIEKQLRKDISEYSDAVSALKSLV